MTSVGEPRPNPQVLKEYSVLLRAVATAITASEMLYLAASLLDDEALTDKNKAICAMVGGMLDMPEAEPDLIERVLRNLPFPETGEQDV